jgi:hypothetical protein
LKITHNPDPGPLRAKDYPSTGEQLGALWKIVNRLIAGEDPDADALAVRDAVAAVKAKYVKGK